MADLGSCLGLVAPYYNLVLVLILLPLFVGLLNKKNKEIDLKPWVLLFAAIIIYIIEEILTVMNGIGFISSPRILTSMFEMAMISLFIYMLLLQKEIIKR
ncbi:MAG: hypothetical protein ABIJ08_01160 [Nanoarchaeota archaeon]